MRLALITLSFSLIIVAATASNAREPIPNFVQLCISDAGTGFNWQNGAWKQVNFVEYKYIVSKIDYQDSDAKLDTAETRLLHARCTTPLETQSYTRHANFKSFGTCLKVQEVGEEYASYFACHEYHSNFGETDNWEVTISCSRNTFSMRPNGHFHKGHIHDNLADGPDVSYKDSLSIFVGKCVDITY